MHIWQVAENNTIELYHAEAAQGVSRTQTQDSEWTYQPGDSDKKDHNYKITCLLGGVKKKKVSYECLSGKTKTQPSSWTTFQMP